MRYTRTIAPASTPITLTEAKAHLRVDTSDDDTLITALIAAATERLDGRAGILGRALITQTWRLDIWAPECNRIKIDMLDVTSIASVKYLVDAVETTWDSAEYRLGADGNRSFVTPKTGYSWPSADYQEDAYRVTFVTGFADADSVPAPIKAAILLMVGDLYENRESVVVGAGSQATEIPMSATVDALLFPYRNRSF